MIIENLIAEVTRQVTFAAKHTQIQAPLPRVRQLPPLVRGEPGVRVEIAEFEIHRTGVFTGITVQVQPPRVVLDGLRSIPRTVAHQELEYRVQLPLDTLPDDPMLRVCWTILDLDTGGVLVNDDNIADGQLRLTFTPTDLSPDTRRFGITCRVYRALGSDITEILNDGIRLAVRPPLPPGSYVRWRYGVKNPQVEYDPDKGRWWFSHPSERAVPRWSAIHRLDKPCAMASRRSRYVNHQERLDVLPFPLKFILDKRETICEYCFFDGPGKSGPNCDHHRSPAQYRCRAADRPQRRSTARSAE